MVRTIGGAATTEALGAADGLAATSGDGNAAAGEGLGNGR
jgi:hypothetical protein